MLIDANSIIINGVPMAQYLVEAKFSPNKLWSSDTGRNLAGTMSGTLTGIYPKIILQFRKLTKSELETIAPILNSARQITTYYDPEFRRNNTIETYTGDYEITNRHLVNDINRKNEGFSCSVIATRRR